MAPMWLTILAWTYLFVCFASAGVIAYDIFVNHRRQPMGVMNTVFPITALYFGPFALAFYWHWARAPHRTAIAGGQMGPATVHEMAITPDLARTSVGDGLGAPGDHRESRRAIELERVEESSPVRRDRPRWVTMAIEVSHCGSGCTLGDVIAEFAIFALGLTIAGPALPAEYIGDYLFAVALGIVFQYFAIAPMMGLGLKDGLKAAAKADVISLTFFEIGLFGWMALMAFVLFPAPITSRPTRLPIGSSCRSA
ncbi:MAG: DUF4396 domain-containing protein [Acidimicrobiales bacterium]